MSGRRAKQLYGARPTNKKIPRLEPNTLCQHCTRKAVRTEDSVRLCPWHMVDGRRTDAVAREARDAMAKEVVAELATVAGGMVPRPHSLAGAAVPALLAITDSAGKPVRQRRRALHAPNDPVS